MSNLIKTNFEFPRGDDLQKQGQRLAQDLSITMKGIKSELDRLSGASITTINGIDGVEVSKSFSISVGTPGAFFFGEAIYTIPHNLGAVPSGFIVKDFQWSSSISNHAALLNISKTAWTSTDITIKIAYGYDTAFTISGSFKLIILK